MRNAIGLTLVIGMLTACGGGGGGGDEDIYGGDFVADRVGEPAGPWWRPAPGTSWQWQLSGDLDLSYDVDMYDIDLFDTPAATIAGLQAEGRIVICYFSAGSWEDWRPDAADFPAAVRGDTLDGWPDERWLDVRALDVLAPILEARLDMAVAKGCDGVEPDNVDGYQNDSGFPLAGADQIAFNRWLAKAAHARNLSVGLKNDLSQIPALVGFFDWALNEQCFQYHECNAILPFVDAGKAVFGVEYELDAEDFCDDANGMNFDWLVMTYDLDGGRESCR
ncbi:MAG: endo alpha-1,4 polygalactosaminidase [Pseudomonadota bacterium]